MVETLSAPDKDGGDKDGGVATWALALLAIPGVLVLVLLWRAFAMCCRRKTVVV